MPGLFDKFQSNITTPSRQFAEYAIPGERAINVAYTNNTSVDIDLFILSTVEASIIPLEVVINEGLPVETVLSTASVGTAVTALDNQQALRGVVPPGATYKARGRSVSKWQEYRA